MLETTSKSKYKNKDAFSAAEFVEAYALFLDLNDNLVYCSSTCITDSDYEIKPGTTFSGQIDSYKDFDHAEVYLRGRR